VSTESVPTNRSQRVDIRRIRAGRDNSTDESADDQVAIEEPLEIRIGFETAAGREEKAISVTMRTPGNDEELAVGFLFTEGILATPDDVVEVWHRSPPVPGDAELRNVIRVDLRSGADVDLARLERHFYTSSSCGVCGKTSLDALHAQSRFTSAITESPFLISTDEILTLTGNLEEQQQVFSRTGGLHASGLFDASGNIGAVREDVGRHNAMDKLIGRLFLDGTLPVSDCGILVSGRASFELVQKVAMAGVPMLAAVGAPSSLAVEAAKDFGITLIGFLREGRFNIYSADGRVPP
jgi:FdhD protein